jgi:hypothetical protein
MKKDEPFDRLLERASRAHADVRPRGQCLDAETLAALTDGFLSADERAAAEAHVADCERCLAMIAAIARTSPPPVVVTRPSWISLRWLVPLATAAIAVTAWVFVQPSSNPPASTPEATLADRVGPAEPAAQAQRDPATQSRIDALEKKAESAPEARKEQDLARRKADSASKPSDVSADRFAQSEQRSAEAGNAKFRDSRPTSPPPAAAAPSIPSARGDARDERVQQKLSAAAPLPVTIQSPDPSVQWRIAGRSAERSTDGGATWQPQETGTAVDLLAGTSPAKEICWIVGRNGLVLLTTDGTTWHRLNFPDSAVDLVGITARDARQATVFTANGRRYLTTDGGRTWTLQENPAAPF